MKRTKIICTLGPASSDEKTIAKMLKNGMNVARFNFSHGTHEYHKEMIETFRRVRDELGIPAAVMLDTKGPEIRLKEFKEHKVTLNEGAYFTLTTDDVEGNADMVSVTYKDLPSQMNMGDRVLIDDGKVVLEVLETSQTDMKCRVITGGEISDKKGVNIPGKHLDFQYISRQDEADLIFGVEMDVDFVAASFVRSKEDVIAVRNLLDYYGGHNIKIISKIENIEGVENFDEILRYSDGIMVARGDMGVEIEYEKLPGLQKSFIKKCYEAGKMVITATQMLESMVHSATPTRAEITDVANAVFDGTSAVMLSGETAMGNHPDLAVSVMAKIVCQAETDAFSMNFYSNASYENDVNDTANAICDAACTTARDLNAAAIIAVTMSGFTARRVSKFRPHEIIVAATPDMKTYHQLSMSWGVFPVKALFQSNSEELFMHAVACAKKDGYVSHGDRVVITAGNGGGSTNVLRVEIVGANVKEALI